MKRSQESNGLTMSLTEIKAAIPNLSPREQAELDLWLEEREEAAIRQVHFLELRDKLQESYDAVAAGRVHPWTEDTIDGIRDEARRRRAARNG
jgi:hypothetical protein